MELLNYLKKSVTVNKNNNSFNWSDFLKSNSDILYTLIEKEHVKT